MYNLKVMSDVHLEMYDTYPGIDKFVATYEKTNIDIICLCGDIGDPGTPTYEMFLRDCAHIAKVVIFVILGNHEMYGKTPQQAAKLVQDVVANIGDKVVFLNNTFHDIGNWRFLGSTLWSDIDTTHAWNIRTMISDFQRIKGWCIGSCKEAHNMNMLWLRINCDLAEEDGKQVVILTHHAPLMSVGHPKYKSSNLKSAFASDLHDFIKRRTNIIRYWFYGHDHYSLITKVDNTIIASNQVGYYDDYNDTKYDRNFLLTI